MMTQTSHNAMMNIPQQQAIGQQYMNQPIQVNQPIQHQQQLAAASPLINNSAPQMSGSTQNCIRNGCPNPAVCSPDWEDEYCSNECVITHCR